MNIEIGQVLFSSPNNITVYVDDLSVFEQNKNSLQVGNLLKIEDGNHNFVICSIENIGGTVTNNDEGELWKFSISCMPIGFLEYEDGDRYKFIRGGKVLPVPTERALLLDDTDWDLIYSNDQNYNFEIGKLSSNKNQKFKINGNYFFSKHSAIVGSTGSGKSCSVASLLQSVVQIKNNHNLNIDAKKNAHIIILDLHAEYTSAFKLAEEQQFNLNILTVDKIFLPYWLMNSEELESLFIESNEANSHNQVSQFKNAVILNKKKYNPTFQEITYDTPLYFSIFEVLTFIRNKNKLTTYEGDGGTFLAIRNRKDLKNIDENLWEDLDFYPSSGTTKVAYFNDSKVSSSDGFKGEFTRFVSRLETKLSDKRLNFLLDSKDEQGNLLQTNDCEKILKQFIGYLDRSNVSILDLSAIPFEVLSIVVSLVSRLLFDFSFHYSKIKHTHNVKNDIPILLVCEEAHIYLPRDEKIDYRASRKAIERIAKEGRKYGISLMVVSQRPSEVSDTILSQCSNFIALRLTNYQDQNYIKSLLPDSANTLVDMLPILSQGEAFIVGDSVILPSLVQFSEPNPFPQSGTVDVYDEWNKDWIDVDFSTIINKLQS